MKRDRYLIRQYSEAEIKAMARELNRLNPTSRIAGLILFPPSTIVRKQFPKLER